MKQKDKEILSKDLCARLPYEQKVKWRGIDVILTPVMFRVYINEGCKPYLRPMSSMTEEEKEEYCDLQDKFLCSSLYPVTDAYELFDWLNEHHFDYRGLIPMGLALEAKKGMYKTE